MRLTRPAVLMLLVAATASAADLHVDPVNGSDLTGDGSAARPWQTPFYGIRRAVSGDRVHFAPGVSEVSTSIRLEPGVSVLGAGAERSVLRWTGTSTGSILATTGEGDLTGQEIAGLRFEGPCGRLDPRAWVTLDKQPGGLPLLGPVVRDNVFRCVTLSLSAFPPGGDTAFVVERNRFEGGPETHPLGLGSWGAGTDRSVIRNNVFTSAGFGGVSEAAIHIHAGGRPTDACRMAEVRSLIAHNLFHGCDQAIGTAPEGCASGTTTVYGAIHLDIIGNVFTRNRVAYINHDGNPGGEPARLAANVFHASQYSSVYYPGVDATTAAEVNALPEADPLFPNLDLDPLLADPAGLDFHLRPGSPCLDLADPALAPVDDLDRDPRPQGAGPDIGADERVDGIALLRGTLTRLEPPQPPLGSVFPPATVIVPDWTSSDVDPDLGVLGRAAEPLVVYQLSPAPPGPLLAVKDPARDTVRLRLR